MSFRPLAFKYLHDVRPPSGQFLTFSVPTAALIKAPGYYAPKQGRYWAASPALAAELFNYAAKSSNELFVIEAWIDRSTLDAPDYQLMGYALIQQADFYSVIVDGCLAVHIMTQLPAYS